MYVDKTTNLDDLKKFGSVEVVLESVPDAEAWRTAANLRFLFTEAGWNVVSHPLTTLPPDGVEVAQYFPPLDKQQEYIGQQMRSGDICLTTVAWLVVNDWEASSSWTDRGELTANQIRVRVGFKPNPYLGDPQLKAAKEAMITTLRARVPNANPRKAIETEYLPDPVNGLSYKVRPRQ
jgi:hypothetical protein